MGILDIFKTMLKGNSNSNKGQKQKCPNCGEILFLNQERCEKCGIRVKSMFRMSCPKCKNLNELDAKKCTKCKYDFEAEFARAARTFFVCPICGYKSEAYLTECPACSTRFG
ncbi:MAG: hypothetical protein AABX38_06000 [Candidatus Micrarchaeota archaeon]